LYKTTMAFMLGGAAAGAIGGAIAYKKAQSEMDQLFANDDEERGDKAWEKTSAKMVQACFAWRCAQAHGLLDGRR